VVCVHVCATARSHPAALLNKVVMTGRAAARDEIHLGAAAPQRIRRRLFGHKCGNLEYYDLVINTERIPVAQCVEQVRWLAQSPAFQPTTASQGVLASLLQETQQHSTPSASEPTLIAREVMINSSRVKLG